MEMTKEELQRRISELKADLARGESEALHCKKALVETQQRIAVIDRPKVTPDQIREIQDAIYQIVKNVDFTDSNNYDMDFEIDYDNRITVSSMDFDGAEGISDDICSEVSALFNIIDTEDEV
jgi:hypothetical protein